MCYLLVIFVEQTNERSLPNCPLVPGNVEYACEMPHVVMLKFAAVILHVVWKFALGKRQMKQTYVKSTADHLRRQCATLLSEDRS